MSDAAGPRGSATRGRVARRALGIDLGTRRIGVAVSATGGLAFPRPTVARSGDEARDRGRLVELAREAGATTVVVGLPLSLDGTEGPAARRARAEAQALAEVLAADGIDVETFDERLTTVSAMAALASGGTRGPAARRRVDSAAATVLLQAWLDRQ